MLTFDKASSQLVWGGDKYQAVTGGFGKGPLPSGRYEVKLYNTVVDGLPRGMTDPLTGDSWFIPLKPTMSTTRDGFGIHPDGPPVGTKGCIGLTGADAGKFWKKWNATPFSGRPTELSVSG